MATPYFKEIQRLRDNRWIIVVILAASAGALAPLAYIFYWQIGQGVALGNTPMKNSELGLVTGMVLIAMTVVSYLLYNLRLEVSIEEVGIRYRMFPMKSKWRLVKPSDIETFSFSDRFKAFQSGGIGYHRNVFNNLRSFRIAGGKHLIIKFKDGHRLLLGTQDRGGMEWAMHKLMTKTTS